MNDILSVDKIKKEYADNPNELNLNSKDLKLVGFNKLQRRKHWKRRSKGFGRHS